MSGSDSSEQQADAPAEDPPAPQLAGQPVYVKRQPLWTYFLTPAALLIGSGIISGTIWWTQDDDAPAASAAAVIGAVSTAAPAGGASTTAGLLDTVKGYANQLGLDEAKFNQCVNSQQNVAQISQHLQAGNALGVTGTPTFFINNKRLVGAQPIAILEEIIQAELKGSPTSLDGYSAGIRQLAATTPPNFSIVESKPDVSGASIEGNTNAKVMVAEFSDFQCPFCKQWNDQSLRQLRTRLGDDVALAFMHFPIVQIHPNAGNASLVAVCAGQQGKFWEMHDLLFARQTEWANLK